MEYSPLVTGWQQQGGEPLWLRYGHPDSMEGFSRSGACRVDHHNSNASTGQPLQLARDTACWEPHDPAGG